MAEVSKLLERIDAEFNASQEKIKKFQTQKVEEHKGREERLEKFSQLSAELRDVWKPPLEALAKRFGERVEVTPTVTPSRREAQFKFQSPLARIDLRFSVVTDNDVRNVIFNYDLEILPILMEFEKHADLKFPLDKVDREALARWIDDRIVAFVRTYLSVHENNYYLKGHLVQDPIAGVSFPKYAAGATLERGGTTYYFIGEETRREFEKKQPAAAKTK
jgi:YHS domain-containing protein